MCDPPIAEYKIDDNPRRRWRPTAPIAYPSRMFVLLAWAFSPVIAWFVFLLFWFVAWPWIDAHWVELTSW
jgi:hypothetical protein